MTTKLATALTTVLDERGLSSNLGKAAEAIGVSYPSLRAVLNGSGKPNKATAAKYRDFLGVSEDDFTNLLADSSRGGKKAKGEKPAKGKRGRPAAATAEVAFSRADEGESEVLSPEDVAPAAATPRAARAKASTSGDLEQALAAIQGFLDDELVLKVHAASPAMRSLIAKILR